MVKRKKSARKPSLQVKADADASIKAVAKVGYEVRKTVKQEIPLDVTRARSSAWLDLISPLTEWAGLKGDELRSRRALLRVQKEEALTAIALRAQAKLEIQSGKPLPNKFVVPFLEQASLEDVDSPLIEMWADLLVSASENFGSYHTHFVSIIGQLSGKQGAILKDIVGTDSERKLDFASDNIRMYYTQNNFASGIKHAFWQESNKLSLDPEQLDGNAAYNIFRQMFNHVAVDPVYISFDRQTRDDEEWYEVDFEWQRFRDEEEVDFSILEAVGLIRRVETSGHIAEWEYRAIYHYVTDLGVHFSRSCGLFRKMRTTLPQRLLPRPNDP